MAGAHFELLADTSQASLQGSLDHSTVPKLWPQLRKAIRQGSHLSVSLQQVDAVNSAALALLLEAKAFAQKTGKSLTFTDLPASLQNLAHMSNAQDLL